MIKITKAVEDVMKRDRRVMFTTTKEDIPFVVQRGERDHAWDIAGNRYIDFSSFIGVYNLGVNGNAEIRKAAKEQIDRLMHSAFLDYYAELPVSFAESLVGMMPKGFGRVFWSNSGTEAIEDAIKLARIFTKKYYMMGFYNSFHGRSMGSLGLTSSKVSGRKHFGPFPHAIHAIYPNPYRPMFGASDPDDYAMACIDYIERNIFARECSSDEIAAIVFEPVQGEGGYVVPPKLFIKELRKLATENNILLVADEIQSGYMRTGKFLACEHFGITADIYAMAKALGGGMPIGATIAKTNLGDTPPGSHAGTFGGNLVSMAAGYASIKYLRRNKRNLESMAREKGRYMLKRLEEMKDRYEMVGDVRGLGMMLAAELVKDKKSKEPAIKERKEVLMECFRNGLVMLPCGVSTIRVIPPITMLKENVEKGLDIFEDAIAKVSGRKK